MTNKRLEIAARDALEWIESYPLSDVEDLACEWEAVAEALRAALRSVRLERGERVVVT